jgi:hypothetical protein
MCILSLDSFLTSTKQKMNSLKKKIISFFEIFPCVKRKNRKDSNATSFMNPYYDPHYELREVVVIPNNQPPPIVSRQPLQEESALPNRSALPEKPNQTLPENYLELNVSNNMDSMEANVFSDSEIDTSGLSTPVDTESDSDYDMPIFFDKKAFSIIKPEPLYENINNFSKNKVIENENTKLREIVFNQIKNKRVSYSKALSDIPEYTSVSSYSTSSESEISEHINPEEDSFMDNLEEKYNHQISQSQISIRSEDINENASSEDNWDVLSN